MYLISLASSNKNSCGSLRGKNENVEQVVRVICIMYVQFSKCDTSQAMSNIRNETRLYLIFLWFYGKNC